MSCVARALPANRTLQIAVADQLADVLDAAGVDDGGPEDGQDLLAGRRGALHGRGDLAHRDALGFLAGNRAGHELEQVLPRRRLRREDAQPLRPTTMRSPLRTSVMGMQRAAVPPHR